MFDLRQRISWRLSLIREVELDLGGVLDSGGELDSGGVLDSGGELDSGG